MESLQVFNFDSKNVRTVQKDNDVWFVAKDVCDILEIINGRDAVSRLDDDEKATVGIPDTSYTGVTQNRNMTIINESGLYSLIMTSNKPEAKRFKKWITSEVIPMIRKTGMYATQSKVEELLQDPIQVLEQYIKVATELKEKRIALKNLELKQLEDKPKVDFYDSVTQSDTWHKFDEVSKIINMRGYGRNNLIEMLRKAKVLNDINQPYQKYIDAGYFKLIMNTYTRSCNIITGTTTVVSAKGIEWIMRGIKKHEEKVAKILSEI